LLGWVPAGIFGPTMHSVVRARISVLLFCLLGFFCLPVAAQTDTQLGERKRSANELFRQLKYTEALPLLEKIVAAEPGDAQMWFRLGFALVAQATNTKDVGPRQALRGRAHAAFVKAKDLGLPDPLVDAMISSIPPDGADGPAFSANIAANSLMIHAEAVFSQGQLDEALRDYQKALELDPGLYHAAVFAGDVMAQKGDFTQSETWYQRAIAIDPTKETAYRYSATSLMRQDKFQAARDRYVEAFITEPYSQFALSGLVQWAQATQTALAHPAIDLPVEVTLDAKGEAQVSVDAGKLGDAESGAAAWNAYGPARAAWRNVQFALKFPNEPAYRHSLAEEVDALRTVIAVATDDMTVKKPSPTLGKLNKLNQEGLLEAYVLLARADKGIAQDHPAYLKDNRDKLRRYMLDYVVKGGGN